MTTEQLDGLACVKCGREFTVGIASVPVDIINGSQVFACVDCD
jgi:DNA-directed RNA polymerase subunit RPC12/RpoP